MLRKLATSVLAFFLVLVPMLLLLECSTRWYFSHFFDLNIEMWKYAKTLKGPSSAPGVGHWHRANTHAILFGVETRINSLGLRDREIPYQKSSGLRRIMDVGDCMVFGWGVELEKTAPKVLETRLTQSTPASPVEVLNLGVGNYNTTQERALLNAEGWKYDPDAVLVHVFLNDPEPSYANTRSNWLFEHSQFASLLWCRLVSLQASAGTQGQGNYYEALFADGSSTWNEFRDSLSGLVADCRKRSKPVGIVVLPVLYNLDGDYPFTKVHEKIAALCNELRVPYVDALTTLRGHSVEQLAVSPNDPHYNATAQALVVEATLPLAQELLKSPPSAVSQLK